MFDMMDTPHMPLDRREDLPHTLLNLTSEGCWVGDRDLTTTYVNRALCQMLGYSEEELLGRSLLEFADDNNRSVIERQVAKRDFVEHRTYEVVLKKKNNEDLHTIVNATRLTDQRGQTSGSFAFITNISHRKQTETFLMRLAEQEQLMASLSRPFLHADIGEAIHHALAAAGRFLKVDRAYVFYAEEGSRVFTRIHEWKAQGVAVPLGLEPPVLSEDSWSVATLRGSGILQLEHCQDFPLSACGAGELFASGVVQASLALPILFDRRFMGFIGVDSIHGERRWGADDANLLRRVSEIIAMGLLRTEVEENLMDQLAFQRSLIETIPIPLYYKDRDGRYLGANQAFELVSGVPVEHVVGKTVFDIQPPESAARHHDTDLDLLSQGGRHTVEDVVRYADGQDHTVILSKAVFLDADQNKRGIIGVLQDITEHVRIERELEASRSELEQLNQQKNRFFSIIAHDLKNPFNAILGFTEIIAEHAAKLPPEKIQAYARNSHDAGRQVLALLENLLEWSRLQMNRISFEPDTIDLALVAQTCTDLLQAAAQQKALTLENRVAEDATAFSDHAMTETVVRNLVNNAVKFTPAGGRVWIEARVVDDDWVEVSVTDTGIGVPPEQIARLFRLDEHHSTQGTNGEEGSGLGLLLCKGLVERQGGRLTVDSAVGEGSMFRFTLPRRPPAT